MADSFVQEEWEDVCSRLRRTAEYFGSRAPQHADSIQQQATELCEEQAPDYYPALLDSVRAAAKLANGWRRQYDPEEEGANAENLAKSAAVGS